MKRFLEMIETVKRQRFIEVIPMLTTDSMENSKQLDRFNTEFFFHLVEKCQPFVFQKTGNEVEELDLDSEETYSFDSPFPIFHIEIFGNYSITVSREDDAVRINIDSIMVVEQSAKEYVYFLNAIFPDRPPQVFICADTSIDQIVKQYVDRINKQSVGVESVRERVKLGTGKEKRTHTIRKIIHVTTKKRQYKINPETRREVDWSHRWLVRGHWRSIPGRLGKDREGNYSQENFTWVKEHEKGPEDKILVPKVRVIQRGEDDSI